jgi:hypothetical protein
LDTDVILYIPELENKSADPFLFPGRRMSSVPYNLPFTNLAAGGQNGRVSLTTPPSAGGSVERIPGYGHQTSVDTDFEHDMLRGNFESSPVSRAFFSVKNIGMIQHAIRKEVFDRSQPKGYLIDDQSIDELKVIMRAMYLQYSRNLPTGVAEQVAELNQKVVDWSAPHILSAVDHYFFYLDDISHMPIPLAKPQSMSSAGTKSLPFNPYM